MAVSASVAVIANARVALVCLRLRSKRDEGLIVRGFISGTLGKKMGLKVESAKREDGTRFYSLAK
jgi:hypothetical protein